MKILNLFPNLYPCKTGGVEIFGYYLTIGLAKRNNVVIVTNCHKVNLLQNNITVVSVDKKKFISGTISSILNDFTFITKFRKEIDVIHAPYTGASWKLGLYLPFIRKSYKIPYVISIHGGGMHEWGPKSVRKSLFKNASAIVAGTKSFKNVYEQRLKRDVHIIPPLIPFSESSENKISLRNKYGYSEKDTIVLCVGSIKRIKGNDTLLDAFVSLEENIIDSNRIKLCFVGDGPLRKELEQKIKNYKFQNNVKFVGNVKYEEVCEFYKMSDIYVIASWYEGISLTLLEAMFNGLLIIGSDTVGIRDDIINGFNGFLFQPKDDVKLKKILKFVVEEINSNQMHLVRKNAIDYYKSNFSFIKAVKAFENVLNNSIM